VRESESTEKQGEIRKGRWMRKLLKDLAEKEETIRRELESLGVTGKLLYNAYPLLVSLLWLSVFGCSFLTSPLWVSCNTFLEGDTEDTPLTHG